MAFTKSTTDLANISKLDDEPNDVGGLSAAELKAEFDAAAETLQTFVNSHITELESSTAAGNVGALAVDGVTASTVQAVIVALKTLIDACETQAAATSSLLLKEDKTVTAQHYKAVTFDGNTGIFTFTRENNSTTSIDTALEKVATNWAYDAATQSLVLTLADGSTQSISLSAFITENEYLDSDTLDFSVSAHKITATIKSGCITDAMLASALKTTLQNYVAQAGTSATNAAASEANALTYKNAAQTAQTAAVNAQAAAESAQEDAESAATAAIASKNAAATSEANALSYKNAANTSATNAATSEANALSYKNAAATSAGNAATSESNAVAANTAIQNMTVAASTLDTGAPATVDKTTVEGVAHLAFGLPRGATGAKGDIGAQGPKGETGSAATVQVGTVTSGATPAVTNSGTSTAAVLNFVLEKGDKGDTGAAGSAGADGALIASGDGYALNNGSTRATLGSEAVDESYTDNTTGASGNYSHAEGNTTTASGLGSHAEGNTTTASGDFSHAEGTGTTASRDSSHAEGTGTTASGLGSHAEGIYSTASGYCSHAEGLYSTASGYCSHAEGDTTTASGEAQHVFGKANIIDTTSLEIVGNGAIDEETGEITVRSNARTLDTSGNGWFAGKVSTGTVETPAIPTAANDLTPKQYVDALVNANTASISELTANLSNSSLIGSEIYGAYWDKGETPTLTRLNLAKGATVNLGVDAVYAINEFDTSSLFSNFEKVTDSYGNVFVRIPRIYIKKVDTTGHKAWYASRRPFTGAYLPKCFWDFTNSKELDYVDVGTYNASSADGIKLDSKAGTYPLINKNIVQFRTMAQANGAGYQQLDIHVVDLLQTLFIIEQGTIQSQSKVAGFTTGQYTATHLATATEAGVNRIIVDTATAALYEVGQAISVGTSLGGNQIFYGRTITAKTVIDASNTAIEFDGTAVNIAVGNVLYNTGAKNGFSANIAASVGSPVSNSSGKFPFVWHGIENLFGSIYQFVDGVNISERQAWVCPDAASYASNLFTAPYEQLSYVNGAADGYTKEMGYDPAHPYAAFPTTVGGSVTTYYGDSYCQATGQRVALLGGRWADGAAAGLFYWYLNNSSSNAYPSIGGRLVRKAL